MDKSHLFRSQFSPRKKLDFFTSQTKPIFQRRTQKVIYQKTGWKAQKKPFLLLKWASIKTRDSYSRS